MEFLVENRAGQAFPIGEHSEFATFSSIQDATVISLGCQT